MRRQKRAATRFPGVERVGENLYRIRAKFKHPKTGRTHEIDRVIEAESAAEASAERARLIAAELEREGPRERVRLSTYLDTWIARKKMTLAPGTLERYARTLQQHVLPVLGDYWIDAITRADVTKWRDSMEGEASSINSRFRVLKTALADATVEYELPRNPADRIPCLPEDGYDDEEPNSLSAEQLGQLLDAVRAHAPRWYALFAVLAFTGARVGEVTALRWEDVTDDLIIIRRSHWRGRIRNTTKTKKWRRVPLPPALAAILSDHRRSLMAAQGEGSDALQARALRMAESPWVFPSIKGTPRYASAVLKTLLGVLEEIETAAKKQGKEQPLPHFTTHGLRRTMNNLLRQTTHDRVVQRAIIGHVTERMSEHYSSVAQSEKTLAVTRVLSLVRTRPLEVGTSVGTETASNG